MSNHDLTDPIDPVLNALDELVTVLQASTERNRTAIRRAHALRRLRERGHRYGEIVPREERPLIVELLTRTLSELAEASSHLRRVEARALYSEGLTMAEIADLFGVTRQRVSALLHSRIDATDRIEGVAVPSRRSRRTLPEASRLS
jgi:DNA-directed RNA polymerase specialized sigma24 family protein